jgi:hypothetical protein
MNIKLELTQEQLNIIATALQDMPFKAVAPLINNINTQIQAQIAPAPNNTSSVDF